MKVVKEKMSNYTVSLKRVSEIYGTLEVISWFSSYNELDFITTTQLNVINTLGIFSKNKLANLIFEHYYMREIAYETPAEFKHFSKVKMNEIMRKIFTFNLYNVFRIYTI